MGKIYCMMGKSSSGKDTLFKLLLANPKLSLKNIVPYTTRPIREGETNGVEYYFCTEQCLRELEQSGKIIELRAYDTIHGVWSYFTVDDHQIQDRGQNYLMIGTLESYQKLKEFFGNDRVIPIYIEVEDGIRLQRALERERAQKYPKYEELCRRFIADAADFSEEKLSEAGIVVRFENNNLQKTAENIEQYMLK